MAPVESTEQTATTIAALISGNNDVEVSELDKSGHVQKRWLHEPSGRIIHVIGVFAALSLSQDHS